MENNKGPEELHLQKVPPSELETVQKEMVRVTDEMLEEQKKTQNFINGLKKLPPTPRRTGDILDAQKVLEQKLTKLKDELGGLLRREAGITQLNDNKYLIKENTAKDAWSEDALGTDRLNKNGSTARI